MKRFLPIMLLALIVGANKVSAQSEEEAIKKTIMTMFDGMRKGDSAMVHSVFEDKAIMQTIAANRSGKVVVNDGSLEGFLKAVGTPHDQVWDEKIEFSHINIDGPMASVWTPYEFHLGGNFSHCGVNSFQLYKGDNGWKIIYIVDTRRRDNCK